MRKRKHIAILLALMVGFFFQAQAQSGSQYATFQSMFIYNFTKYINWPTTSSPGAFKIGVLGVSPLQAALEDLARTKTVANKPIQVGRLANAQDALNFDLVFVTEAKLRELSVIQGAVGNRSVLVVAEGQGNAGSGGAADISLFLKDGKMAFEICNDCVVAKGMQVQNSLLSLGSVVHR